MTALLTQILQRPIAFHRIFAQIASFAAGGLFYPNFGTGETRGAMVGFTKPIRNGNKKRCLLEARLTDLTIKRSKEHKRLAP